MKIVDSVRSNFSGRKFLIVLVSFPLFLIVFFEVLERSYDCPSFCIALPVCDVQRFPPDAVRIAMMTELRNENHPAKALSEEELQLAFEKIIIEVAPLFSEAPGVICNDMIYVRNDLPTQAKLFVKRHELAHALSNEGYDSEFSATWIAAKEYPLGLISTIFFSLKEARKDFSSFPCYLIAMWKTFKVYFLP